MKPTPERMEELLNAAIEELYNHLSREDRGKIGDYLGMTKEEKIYFDVEDEV